MWHSIQILCYCMTVVVLQSPWFLFLDLCSFVYLVAHRRCCLCHQFQLSFFCSLGTWTTRTPGGLRSLMLFWVHFRLLGFKADRKIGIGRNRDLWKKKKELWKRRGHRGRKRKHLYYDTVFSEQNHKIWDGKCGFNKINIIMFFCHKRKFVWEMYWFLWNLKS